MMKGRERATAGKPSGPKVRRDVKRGKNEKMTTQKKVIKRDRKEGEWMTAQKKRRKERMERTRVKERCRYLKGGEREEEEG